MRLQELKLHLATVTEDLAHILHRSPTTAEVAARLGVTQREVLLARSTATAYRPLSVHQPASGRDDLYLLDVLAVTDHGIEAVDNRETLRALLTELPAREQLVIRMRFFADLTQAQIATRIGVSQMHVSRLLARSLARLRDRMLADAGNATDPAEGSHHSPTPATRPAAADHSPASAGPVVSPRG
jgi:RNA polymerase sigma-B factor